MYEQHFGLSGRPFSIAPDPRFLYMSQRHREALAHLLYGVGEGGGFVQLTGEVGTGKTTICRCLLEQLPDNVDVALVLNPRVSGLELIGSLCDELQVDYPRGTTSIKALIDALNRYLLDAHARGRRTVMIIDEAQNLDAEALEQVRLLTNLETTREKLLQIILIGQPELRDLLAQDELRQLSQRITARYHLEPITDEDTSAYIRHRLEVCGATETLFTDKSVKLIQRYSKGIPRLINVLCDRSLLGAFVEGRRQVNQRVVKRAAAEILPAERMVKSAHLGWWAAALLSAGSLILALWLGPQLLAKFSQRSNPAPTLATAPPPDAVPPPLDRQPLTSPQTRLVVTADTVAADHEPPQVTLEQALLRAGPSATARAWTGLFQQWGYRSTAGTDDQACAEALRVELACMHRSGSWTAVKQFDRPAQLVLTGPDGRQVTVLLRALKGNTAVVDVDGKVLDVSQADLQKYWFGKFRLLWKTPPGGRSVLRPGYRGQDVQWLREQLAAVQGVTAMPSVSKSYGQSLKKQVQQFQLSQGLNADGVAGPETLIFLNSAVDRPGVPRLVAGSLDDSTLTRSMVP